MTLKNKKLNKLTIYHSILSTVFNISTVTATYNHNDYIFTLKLSLYNRALMPFWKSV